MSSLKATVGSSVQSSDRASIGSSRGAAPALCHPPEQSKALPPALHQRDFHRREQRGAPLEDLHRHCRRKAILPTVVTIACTTRRRHGLHVERIQNSEDKKREERYRQGTWSRLLKTGKQ